MAWSCSICYLVIQLFTFYQITFIMGLTTNAQDPCTAHLTLTDVTMTTDYVQGTQNPLRYGDFIENFKWYRYTGTARGILASTSPKGTQCLSLNQIWSSDPIPNVGCTAFVHVCIKDNTSPCAQQSLMQVKNCGTFVVYQLSKPPGSRARFCFEGKSTMSPKPTQGPCTSTPSSSTSSSLPSTLSTTTFSTTRPLIYTLSNTTVTFATTPQSTSSKRMTLSTTISSTSVPLTTTLSTTRTSTFSPTTPIKVTSNKKTSLLVRPTTPTRTHKATTTPIQSTSKTHTTSTTTSSRQTSTSSFESTKTSSILASTPQSTTRTTTPQSNTTGYAVVTQKTRIVPTTNTHASQDNVKSKKASGGLIAGIVIGSIILVCSLSVIVWKVVGRQMCTVSKSRTLKTDPLRNAKPKFDVHRL